VPAAHGRGDAGGDFLDLPTPLLQFGDGRIKALLHSFAIVAAADENPFAVILHQFCDLILHGLALCH
jgi:hypothetical protein